MNNLHAPALDWFADVSVEVGTPQEVGQTVHGLRRLIPILGGQVRGQGFTARVLPGGADFQLMVTPRLAELDARYTLETDAGDLIYVNNHALRVAEPALTQQLMRGEPVDPQLIYFRCAPRFETAATGLAWLSERLFLGTGARHPDRVEMRFFVVN